MSFIEIKNLTYKYPAGEYNSLSSINLDINKGEIILILGKSGSGKSTLIKSITGAVPNFYGGVISGSVLMEDKDLRDMTHKERTKKVSVVFQDPEKQLVMDSVHREVAFSLENIGVDEMQIKRRVFEALKFLNILDLSYRKLEELSGGEKQKVVLASALAMNTDVIILDEPTSQLDPQSAEELVYLVRKINIEFGKTIIVAEQRVDKWFDISDKILLLDKGQMQFYGNTKEFYLNSFDEFLPQYLRIAKMIKIDNLPKYLYVRSELSKYKFNKKHSNDININKNSKNKFSFLKRSNSYIHLKNISVKYNNKFALRNINLQLEQGLFYSILGENGAGKSTLLKTIVKLTNYSGDIILDNKNINSMSNYELAQKIGYVSQNPNDYLSKDTVYEEIKFTLDNFGVSDYSSIDYILEKFDLIQYKDRNPRDLSGGEKQRLAIASVLIMNPDVLILDEPTRGLNTIMKDNLGILLRNFIDEGKTVIMVTHDVDFAAEYSDNIILIMNGEVIQSDTKENILKDGLYYTSTINKITGFRDIYTMNELKECIKL